MNLDSCSHSPFEMAWQSPTHPSCSPSNPLCTHPASAAYPSSPTCICSGTAGRHQPDSLRPSSLGCPASLVSQLTCTVHLPGQPILTQSAQIGQIARHHTRQGVCIFQLTSSSTIHLLNPQTAGVPHTEQSYLHRQWREFCMRNNSQKTKEMM